MNQHFAKNAFEKMRIPNNPLTILATWVYTTYLLYPAIHPTSP